MTGWLPIGSTVICSPLGETPTILVLQTNFALPLTFIPQEPQIEALQAHLKAREVSSYSLT